jgi:HrpA-like RNA helicase
VRLIRRVSSAIVERCFRSCVSEALTAVALLSTDNVFIHPYREAEKQAANNAHRRFAVRDGDIPALVNIFEAWLQVREHFLDDRFQQLQRLNIFADEEGQTLDFEKFPVSEVFTSRIFNSTAA